MHGYSKETIEGKTIWEVLPPESCNVLVPYYRAALAGQEESLDSESGGLSYTTRFVPVRNEQGATYASMAVSLDVTEQKRVEAAQVGQQAAEQANRAKSEFLSRMSHELRTPHNAILGFGQLLQMDVKTPDLQESVGYILKAGGHLLNLINDVLEIARIEEGKLEISLEPVLVDDVLQESLDLVQSLVARRNIRVEVDRASVRNCCVMADRQRLQQVLLNLIHQRAQVQS